MQQFYQRSSLAKPYVSRESRARASVVPPLILLFLWLLVGQTFVSAFLQYVLNIYGFAAVPYLNLSAIGATFVVFSFLAGRSSFFSHPPIANGLAGLWQIVVIIVAFIGFCAGAYEQNSALYLISDTFYFATWIVGGLAASIVFSRMTDEEFKSFVLLLAKTMTFAFAASTVFILLLKVPPQAIVIRIAQCYLAIYIFYKPARNKYLILSALALISVTLFGSNRATILMLFSIIVFASVAMKRLDVAVILLVGAIYGSPLLLSIAIDIVPSNSPLGTRLIHTRDMIEGTGPSNSSLAIMQRYQEENVVLGRIAQSDAAYIIGYGAGATINLTALPGAQVYSGSALGTDKVHNIHFLHIALFYRHGAFGIFLLACTVFLLIVAAVRLRMGAVKGPYRYVALAGATFYCVGTIAFGVPASNFFFAEPLFGFLMSFVLIESRPNGPRMSRFLQSVALRRDQIASSARRSA